MGGEILYGLRMRYAFAYVRRLGNLTKAVF